MFSWFQPDFGIVGLSARHWLFSWAHLWATDCSCCLHHGLLLRRRLRQKQVAQADQVVGDYVQAQHGTDVLLAAQFELPQSAKRLEPTLDEVERSSYSFSIPRRALIDLA
jgi:hypothetical protein